MNTHLADTKLLGYRGWLCVSGLSRAIINSAAGENWIRDLGSS